MQVHASSSPAWDLTLPIQPHGTPFRLGHLALYECLLVVNQLAQSVSENVGLDITFVKDVAGKGVLDVLETTAFAFGGQNGWDFSGIPPSIGATIS